MAYRDQDRVNVSIPQVEETLNVLGVSVKVTSDATGQFRGSYRNEGVGSGDLDAIRKSIELIETERSQKRERSRRLKEAAEQPEPALLYRSGSVEARNRRRHAVRGAGADVAATLEPIHVRGVDQRSGLALIIRESGAKESMTWDLITRQLAGVEKKKLLDLAEKEQRAAKEIPNPVTVKDVLPSIKPVEASATWDADREVWAVKYGREELVAPSGYGARDRLEVLILARLIVKQTPYKFTDTSSRGTLRPIGLVEYLSDEYGRLSSYDNLYKSAAEVHAFDNAMKAARRAEEKREAFLKTLLIDRSQFTDGA